MSGAADTDYVLGTHDEEIARLGLQHRVWRAVAAAGWERAGLTHGWQVLDVGAGPGYATADLAEIVGPGGRVLAVERSARFLDAARARCAARRLENVEFLQADLMESELGARQLDASWCRWVASFVSSPEKLVAQIAGALRPGGVAIFHEYSDYETFCFMPVKARLQEFIREVMASWRAAGGEPNIGKELPRILAAQGFVVRSIHPQVRTVSPRDYTWQWPASFIEINAARLRELGRVSAEWAEELKEEFRAAEKQPGSWFTTPMFLEIIAEKS